MGKAIYGIPILSLTTSAFISQTELFEGIMNQVNQIDTMMKWAEGKVQEVDGIKGSIGLDAKDKANAGEL